MLKSSLIIVLLILSSKLYAQTTDSAVEANNMMMYIDERLNILDERPAALLAELNIEINKTTKPLNTTPVYKEINVGKKTVTGSIGTSKGFRLLIFNGADRNLALKIKTEFARRFPSYHSYMSYNTPNFKIKVGDFTDKKEANKFMKLIIPFLPSASIVPDIVTVKNIQVQ